jgi:ankyrin repeat protein
VYSGLGVIKVVEGQKPQTEYSFRLMVIGPDNEKSEYSPSITVRTTREPMNGEAFQKAVLLDKRAEVEQMLATPSGQRLLEIPDKMGNLPLQLAIIKNNQEMCELLIQLGADVNAKNDNSKTSLMLAAFYGNLNIVMILRQNDASYEIKDRSGMVAIHYAVDGGDPTTLEWMISDGADVNAKDDVNHWTPLLRAASVNSTADIARILIRYNAKVDVMDKQMKNPLMIATVNGNLPFVQVLVESGANFLVKNQFEKSLYDLAVSMVNIFN